MEQVQVKILCQVVTARHGTLNTGALLRTDAAFAKHLVEDCGAAQYVKSPAAFAVPAPKVSKPRNKATAPKESIAQTPDEPDPAGAAAAAGETESAEAPTEDPAAEVQTTAQAVETADTPAAD